MSVKGRQKQHSATTEAEPNEAQYGCLSFCFDGPKSKLTGAYSPCSIAENRLRIRKALDLRLLTNIANVEKR